ncbi:MAG TPA: hypothetical protein DEP84_16525 [Chloroflexi bacterium]|nr:hypothetical protein [Chloroflexota bacterium]
MDRVKVILNPYAGRGKGAQTEQRILRALDAAGVLFDLARTSGAGQATALACHARQAGYRVVVAAGGDGTVSEVVNGLAQATPPGEVVGPPGVLSIGNGNDFAAMAGCPQRVDAAAQAIAAGRTRRVDLGQVEWQSGARVQRCYFDNNVGIGFEGQVNLESHKIKRLRGVPLYLVAVFRALRHYAPAHVELRWESETGEQHSLAQKVLMIAIGNSRRSGGGFYTTPHAELDDGLLDMGIVEAIPVWRIVTLLPKVMRGTHASDPAIRLVRFRRVAIPCAQPLPVHVDGELVSEDAERLLIAVLPGRLEVIV